jgi:hypothetical protein
MKCKKEFKYKSQLARHLRRKTPCDKKKNEEKKDGEEVKNDEGDDRSDRLAEFLFNRCNKLINEEVEKILKQRSLNKTSTENKNKEVKIYGDNDEDCNICLRNKKSIILIPCGHFCVCGECMQNLDETSLCPICRDKIDNYVDISTIT